MRRSRFYGTLLIGGVLGLVLTACGQATTSGTPTSSVGAGNVSGTISVGSKDFTEAILVAEMHAQLLEHAGFTVERKLSLGGTPVAHQALVSGDIDLYPEYTSTGLQEVLKVTELPKDPQAILETVKNGYEQQFKLTWLAPAPFNDSNTFATTKRSSFRSTTSRRSFVSTRSSSTRRSLMP
jgi:osmoprotectant transport system substrate-binding protein